MEKIKPFDPKDDNIYDWLEIFEDKAKLHKVKEDDYNTWLKCQIGRIGYAVLKNTSFNNFSETKEHLKTNLGTRDIAKRSVLELKQLSQKTDENIRQVGARANYLARQAFPGTPSNIQEREAVTAFIKSQPTNMQFELIKGDCKTISDVCTLAEILLEAQKETNKLTINATSSDEWKKEIQELREEIKQMTIEKSIAQTSTRMPGKRCGYCKRPGHETYECRTKQRDQQQQAQQFQQPQQSQQPQQFQQQRGWRQGGEQRNTWQNSYPGVYRNQYQLQENPSRILAQRDNRPRAELLTTGRQPLLCYACGEPNHIKQHCRANTNMPPENGQRAILSDRE